MVPGTGGPVSAAAQEAPRLGLSARAFAAIVRRSDDRRLERLFGADRALASIFARTAARFDADGADGFTGDLRFDLRRSSGVLSSWTITAAHGRATASPGGVDGAALTATLSVADALRILARELDVGRAILEGRLDLAGDFGVAMQLGKIFGGSGKRAR